MNLCSWNFHTPLTDYGYNITCSWKPRHQWTIFGFHGYSLPKLCLSNWEDIKTVKALRDEVAGCSSAATKVYTAMLHDRCVHTCKNAHEEWNSYSHYHLQAVYSSYLNNMQEHSKVQYGAVCSYLKLLLFSPQFPLWTRCKLFPATSQRYLSSLQGAEAKQCLLDFVFHASTHCPLPALFLLIIHIYTMYYTWHIIIHQTCTVYISSTTEFIVFFPLCLQSLWHSHLYLLLSNVGRESSGQCLSPCGLWDVTWVLWWGHHISY